MDISTKVNLALSISSFILAATSVITVIATLIQNHRMLESSTRPYVCIYGESINCGTIFFYIVIKNCGSSAAIMKEFKCMPNLNNCYADGYKCRNFLEDMSSAIIAPGQSRVCRLEYSKIHDPITFELTYQSLTGKEYKDKYAIPLKTGTSMLTGKVDAKGKELRTLSYTLQEILLKNL